jgi:2-keto-4-pentenoate hydratase/2-oxohepta-3-ene-1,7-dioic acid hydratase in catechol pathway
MRLISYRRPASGVGPGPDGLPQGAYPAGLGTGVVLHDAVAGDRVVDITDWTGYCPVPESTKAAHVAGGTLMPAHGMLRLLQAGEVGMAALRQHVDGMKDHGFTRYLALADLELLAPVPRPGKIIGVGRNYADHAKETGVTPFENPRIIFKMPSSIAAPGQTVVRPPGVTKMDYEAELAVVIGGYGHSVCAESALDLVAGYTVLNDLSAREFQFDIHPAQTTFAKSMDGFCPIGPWLVTRDEVPDRCR